MEERTRERSDGKKKIVADMILVAALLLIGLSVFLIGALLREDGAFAVVYIGGERVAEYALDTDGEHELNGGTNILVIEGGRAYMRTASCPDGLCVNQGRISRTGERIVCLPSRVMVEIVGADDGILEVR